MSAPFERRNKMTATEAIKFIQKATTSYIKHECGRDAAIEAQKTMNKVITYIKDCEPNAKQAKPEKTVPEK